MDNKAHMPNEARQPIDVAPATGTLTPEAMAPNMFMDTEYNPVTIPTRNGKSRLIKLGKSTLLNAMPHPKIAVPAYKERTEGNKRKATPMVTIITANSRADSSPKRLARRGAKGETAAKASKGSEVRSPTIVWPIPVSERIISTTGPVAVIGDLMVAAMTIMPANNRPNLLMSKNVLPQYG